MLQNDGHVAPSSPVEMQEDLLTIPTYISLPPDRNPMFLERRVYQGSNGKVYPLPFTDRVSDQKIDVEWQAVRLENEFIQVVVLPQFGGRIYSGLDKTDSYDFVYRNRVIKPALVGLAGPWLSGGIEFNWPQHHRPTTFSAVDHILEEHADGSKTVWLGENEPFNRMKGMHGVTLHPGKSYLEVKVRLYNRTPFPQTFLWWANLAVHVNEQYQAIFPPDVHYVVDHAKRAVSPFPIADGRYYGVDYSPGVDISWFKNIPVPSSYMALGSQHDFVGGYDYGKNAGVIHIADHRVSPGKKLWTWGAGDFGRVWYENLTDEDGPYVELMSGVYTDNQPDFSWLHPYETRTFSQYWYPIRDLGYVRQATLDAAVNLEIRSGAVRIAVNTTARFDRALVQLRDARTVLWQASVDLAPDRPFVHDLPLSPSEYQAPLGLSVMAADGRELVRYVEARTESSSVPVAATPAPSPETIDTTEELYLTGLHLEQYRHATYAPDPYYQEAVCRDAGDARNNNALGMLYLRRGLYEQAAECFRRAIGRLTMKNPNPYDGEPFYNLGIALRFLGERAAAYDALSKATWNFAWQAPAHYALAELDSRSRRTNEALEHLDASLQGNSRNTKARNLRVALLRRSGRLEEARRIVQETIATDLLDFWSRNELRLTDAEMGEAAAASEHEEELRGLMRDQDQSYLDLAGDYAGPGLWDEAIDVLSRRLIQADDDVDPMVLYHLGYYSYERGESESGLQYYRRAAQADPGYCFPNRLDSIAVLRHAMVCNPEDARAPYYLGNLLYDKKRYSEAITLWERSRELDGAYSIVHRNLGLAYFNIEKNAHKALSSFRRAFEVNPSDARLLYELDQLEKRVDVTPQERLARLEAHRELVEQRDDLYLERVILLTQLGRFTDAIQLLAGRHFHPWEGGEGKVTEQYVFVHLARGRQRLQEGRPGEARDDFLTTLTYPPNLGEGKHEVLTSQAPSFYHLGLAYGALGDSEMAAEYYRRALREPETDTEAAYYQGMALRQLGRQEEARERFTRLISRGDQILREGGTIDYFATSLPTFLVFEDDLTRRNAAEAHYARGLGYLGLHMQQAAQEFRTVLNLDRNHLGAQTRLAETDQLAVQAPASNP